MEATLTLLWGTHRRQIDVHLNVHPDVAVQLMVGSNMMKIETETINSTQQTTQCVLYLRIYGEKTSFKPVSLQILVQLSH